MILDTWTPNAQIQKTHHHQLIAAEWMLSSSTHTQL